MGMGVFCVLLCSCHDKSVLTTSDKKSQLLTCFAVTFFLVNPGEHFTGHIDAPADEAIMAAQAKIEGMMDRKDSVEYVENMHNGKATR